MRCQEIRERFVDLLYREQGTPPASPELLAHLECCPSCQHELTELKAVQRTLRLWEDEAPLRPVLLPRHVHARPVPSPTLWTVTRRIAMAAAILLAFLALGNAEIRWEKGSFSFRTRLMPGYEPGAEYYTKSEARDLVRRALDDSEARMMETNYLMMQRVLDTMEQERWNDLRLIGVRQPAARSRN